MVTKQNSNILTGVQALVLDIGGVLVQWNPVLVAERVFEDQEMRARAMKEIFAHQDWRDRDRGVLTDEEGILRWSERLGCAPAQIRALLVEVQRSLVPITGMGRLLMDARRAGLRLFWLSNVSQNTFQLLQESCGFWNLFEGGVISADVCLLKPELAIYETLLRDYDLRAHDTLFVDDTAENVAAAQAVGMWALVFEGPDNLRARLAQMIDGSVTISEQ